MPAQFTHNSEQFVAKSVLESIRSPKPTPWAQSTGFTVGTYMTNLGRLFVCSVGGQSSPSGSGPNHSHGTGQDGGVTWVGLGAYTTSDSSPTGNLYMGFGRNNSAPWDDDEAPPAPVDSDAYSAEILDNLVFALRIDPSDITLGFDRNEWAPNTTYDQYDPNVATNNSIVYSSGNVYRCIDNNGGAASTTPPSGTSAGFFLTADGYVWKYLGGIDAFSMFKFGTPSYIPVPNVVPNITPANGTLSSFNSFESTAVPFDEDEEIVLTLVPDDGTGGSIAARTTINANEKTITGFYVQSAGSGYSRDTYAVATSGLAVGSGAVAGDVEITSGEITSIPVDTSGSDYTDATVIILGDGTGATAVTVVDSGSVSAINVTNGGSGYTWAKAIIIPGDKGAAARVTLGPEGGHGSNLESEINGTVLLISKSVSIGNIHIPSDSDTVDGSFRQISLLGGLVLSTRNAPACIGKSHPDWDNPVQGTIKYQRGGTVLFTNNLEPIVHSTSQEEVVKIAMNIDRT